MNSRTACALWVLVGLVRATFAAEWFVDDDAVAADADGSASKPFKTIQEAVARAASGDTIHVAEGRYSSSSGRVEESTPCESVVIVKDKKLHIIGAGRGKSVIAGSRDPEAGDAYASRAEGANEGDYAVRCVYVTGEDSAGTIVEGFTLCDGETMTTGDSSGTGNAGGGLYADSKDVYLVDCDVVHCAGKYGSPIYKGTAVRCLFDNNYGTGGPGGYRCRLINCVVTRSCIAGSSTAVLFESEIYNCTVVDNKATWTLHTKDDRAYNSILMLSANATAYRETNKVEAVVANCVLASQSSKGNVQLMGPAVGDWRLLPDSDAIGAGIASHLSSLSLPEDVDVFKDFTGSQIVPDANGRINAGAVQSVGTPAAGGLWFEKAIEVNGRKSKNARAATYVYPDVFPTQYCVRAVLKEGESLYRLMRRSPYTGKTHGDYPSAVPQLDGRMWLMPPVDASLMVTNEAQLATTVLWVDAEKGKDDWGGEVEDQGSANHPYATIQAAVDAVGTDSGTYGLVRVMPGVYSNGVSEVEDFGRFRLSAAGKLVRIVAEKGPAHTVICGNPDPDTEDSGDDTAGLGPNAVKCVYLKGRNEYLQGFTLLDGYSDAADTTVKYGAYGAAVSSVNGADSSANVLDCVITNCRSYMAPVSNVKLFRNRIFDCFSKDDRVVNGGFIWGCYLKGCVMAGGGSSSIGIVNCDTFQSTAVGKVEEGRLCGTGGISYNSIWDGGYNLYSGTVFTNSIAWNFSANNGNPSDWRKLDPLFVSREDDGVLRSDSPAVGMGYDQWDSAYGDMYWRFGGGDVNGDPIIFTDGHPTVGAFQSTRNLRKVTAAAPANGGWAFADGTAFGEILVYEGGSLTVVPADGTRPCIGVFCGDREYLFTNLPNETITIAYDALLEMEQGAALTGIYSTFWYVDDDGDDDNTGFLPTHPKKTLSKAASLLESGDTLWVFPGTYDQGGAIGSNGTLTNRVVLKRGVSVISTEGPKRTIIVGSSGTKDPDEYGNGTNAVRCAFLAKNSRLSGFTLTGGRTNHNGGTDDNAGSAVSGAGRDSNSVVDNCIISNNAAPMGTVYKAEIFNSLVVDNVTSGQGVGVRQGNAYNSCFARNTGDSVLSYPRDVIGCTVADDNIRAGGTKKSTHIGNLVKDGRVFNSLFVGRLDINQKDADYSHISNCVCASDSTFNDHATTGNVCLVDFSTQTFVDGVIPVAGANDAVDAADESLATNLYSKTDLRGFQRVMNGRQDIGAYEADWCGVYGTALFSNTNRFAVVSASRDVALVDGAVTIPSGKLEATWRNSTGQSVLYTMPVRVDGNGELSVMQNGEVLGVVHGSDGEVPFSFISREECCVVSFAYEPGDGDAGYAVLGAFTRSRMCGLVFTVR